MSSHRRQRAAWGELPQAAQLVFTVPRLAVASKRCREDRDEIDDETSTLWMCELLWHHGIPFQCADCILSSFVQSSVIKVVLIGRYPKNRWRNGMNFGSLFWTRLIAAWSESRAGPSRTDSVQCRISELRSRSPRTGAVWCLWCHLNCCT